MKYYFLWLIKVRGVEMKGPRTKSHRIVRITTLELLDNLHKVRVLSQKVELLTEPITEFRTDLNHA